MKNNDKEQILRRTKKTKALRKLSGSIDSLRKKLKADLKSDDEKARLTALVISIIDETGERVGNDSSAKDGHYGVTGFQNGHISVSGNKVTIKYVGKSGVDQKKEFTNSSVAGMLKDCKDACRGKSSSVFKTSSGVKITGKVVNSYLSEFGITAKDIRGYKANSLLVAALKKAGYPKDEDERKAKFKSAVEEVAEAVGHQSSTFKTHYMLPGIEDSYMAGKVKEVKNASSGLSILRISNSIVSNLMLDAESDVRDLMLDCIDSVNDAFVDAGVDGRVPSGIDIRLTEDIMEGKIAGYNHSDRVLIIHPKALSNDDYLKFVILHELVHAGLGPNVGHNEEFQSVSDALGIPERYQD